jgi:Mg2+ and Co2+ transporter CorA
MKLRTAHVEPEIELPKMELWEAPSRQKTSYLERAKVGTEAESAMEIFATTPRTTVSVASQTITNMLELHNESLEHAKAADRIRELEDEMWEKEKSVKSTMETMNTQVMQFSKCLQAKNKIINELKKKLNVQNNDGIEDENIADVFSQKSIDKKEDTVLEDRLHTVSRMPTYIVL